MQKIKVLLLVELYKNLAPIIVGKIKKTEP